MTTDSLNIHDPHRSQSAAEPTSAEKLMQLFGLVQLTGSRRTVSDVKQSYERPTSFTDFISIKHYRPDLKCYVHPDGKTIGRVLLTHSINSESRPQAQLESMLDNLESAFRHIPELDDNPYVIQLFVQDEPLVALEQKLRQYAQSSGDDPDGFTDHFLKMQSDHYESIGKSGGIFTDSTSGVRWGGKNRVARMCIYRKFDDLNKKDGMNQYPHEQFNRVVSGLIGGLAQAKVSVTEPSPAEVFQWLFSWLNPNPFGIDNPYDFFKQFPVTDEEISDDYDFGQGCLRHSPKSNTTNGSWNFTGISHRYLPIIGVRHEPRIGALTTEGTADASSSPPIMDVLPSGSIFIQTIIFQPQDTVDAELDVIAKQSRSGSHASMIAAEEIDQVKHAMALGHKLHPTTMGVFLKAPDDDALNNTAMEAFNILQTHGLDLVMPDHDLMPLETYARNLPMGYQPQFDAYLMRQRKTWLRWTLALSPLWGQGTGTGKPCFGFFNRAGIPILVDPFNLEDRESSGHMLVFGPTGAGKSATLNYLVMQVMAIHNPHIFIIDVGDSFRLIGEYMKQMGKKVHYVNLGEGNHALPPFAHSHKLFESHVISSDENNEDKRDYLSEMVSAAKLIITGGEEKEMAQMRRHDLATIQSAIEWAARQCYNDNRQMMLTDFVDALDKIAQGEQHKGLAHYDDANRRARVGEMRDAAQFFCQGFRAKLFDRPGELWPEVDLTIIELGAIAISEEYRDVMALAYIGLMNNIQSGAEKRQASNRFSWVLNDEAHVTTTNPLLSDYVVKGSKMWRKWGLWLCMATQNLEDFPDASEKILNMCEWWFCLLMPKKEIEQIARFKDLSEEEIQLLESARKENKKYTEGVMLSGLIEPTLFRVVPPPITMALAQTEQEEKSKRQALMDAHGINDEIQGVELVAEQMMQARADQ